MNLASNIGPTASRPPIEIPNISRHPFDREIAVWSFEAGYIKLEPPIYELAAAQMDVPPATVLTVGDSFRADVEGPRSAGLQVVHLVRRGGRGDLDGLEPLLEWLP